MDDFLLQEDTCTCPIEHNELAEENACFDAISRINIDTDIHIFERLPVSKCVLSFSFSNTLYIILHGHYLFSVSKYLLIFLGSSILIIVKQYYFTWCVFIILFISQFYKKFMGCVLYIGIFSNTG